MESAFKEIDRVPSEAGGSLRPLRGASFTLVGHGVPTSPPGGGVREHLLEQGARVRSAFHPLGPEEQGRHVLESFDVGKGRRRTVVLPSRPPLTYPLDLLVPVGRERSDVWIGFDTLSTARGLGRRGRGRVGAVAHWAVDFVPDRFGAGTPLTRAYDALDRRVCVAADVRVEVSRAALEARDERHGLSAGTAAAGEVVPVGLWVDRTPQVPVHGFEAPRAVFVGHLVERMGVHTAIEAISRLRETGVEVPLDVVGRGPEEGNLRRLADERDVADLVTFHGFKVGAEFDRHLAASTIALAPYRDTGTSFTQYADPSKLKSYLAAGLPIVLTPVPPNAQALADAGAAELVADDVDAVAAAIRRLASDEGLWRARRSAALEHARSFDWPVVLAPVLERLGFRAS